MQCLGRCARLVLSSSPDKSKARVMLACIARYESAPSRAEVLAEVQRRCTKVAPL